MLHAVTCLFNPCGYRRLVENHRTFAAALARQGVPLTTVELSFDGRFEVPDSVRLFGDPAVHTLWQKERLLNVGIESLPPEVDKVAWVDADLLFLNPDWAADTERILDDVPVCQLFERVQRTNAAGRVTACDDSWAKVWNRGRTPEPKHQPGFAWAARRDLLTASAGLYDRDVIGGGDRSMAYGWAGLARPNGPQKRAAGWWRDYLSWAEPQVARTGGKVGVVPGDLVHLYHGEAKDRQYRSRIDTLVEYDFDPAVDLELGRGGLWRWASDKPALHRAVRRYFARRNDDGVARQVSTWAAGVITAPRAEPTLGGTLASLKDAGFEDVRVFAEPGAVVPGEFSHLPRTDRSETCGAFPNWYLALTELVLRDPRADAYLLCEDDVQFSKGLRKYLERTLWPAKDTGVVSLHTPSHFAVGKPRGWHAEDRGWGAWGAQAYVFPNRSARALLSDPAVLDHRGFGPDGGRIHADCVVGAWCRRSGRPYFVHSPSLSRHTGETSTVWPADRRCTGRRQCAEFLESVDPPPARPRLIEPRPAAAAANVEPAADAGDFVTTHLCGLHTRPSRRRSDYWEAAKRRIRDSAERPDYDADDLEIGCWNNRNTRSVMEVYASVRGIANVVPLGGGVRVWKNSHKLKTLREALRRSNKKYFLALDGDDLLLTGNPRKAIDAIRRSGAAAIYGGERNLYPFRQDWFEAELKLAGRDAVFPFLNSGQAILDRERFLPLLESCLDAPAARVAESDQDRLHRLYIDHPDKIQVDAAGALFRTCSSREDPRWVFSPDFRDGSRPTTPFRKQRDQPPQETEAALILLNWERPENVTRILDAQGGYPEIRQIVVFDNNPASHYRYEGLHREKVVTVDCSADQSLRSRWYAASLAKYPTVIFQDDDLILEKPEFDRVLHAYGSRRKGLVGIEGRPADLPYRAKGTWGEVPILLGHFLVTSKSLCNSIADYEDEFERVYGYKPHNGEDIFLSFCAADRSGLPNRAIRVKKTKLPEPAAISSRPGHRETRTKVLADCLRFFRTRHAAASS